MTAPEGNDLVNQYNAARQRTERASRRVTNRRGINGDVVMWTLIGLLSIAFAVWVAVNG